MFSQFNENVIDGCLVIAASNRGSSTRRACYYNLNAHPTIDVELGTEAFTARQKSYWRSARRTVVETRSRVGRVGRVSSQERASCRGGRFLPPLRRA